MLHQLDWDVIGNELLSCYQIYLIDPDDSNKEKYVEEGVSAFSSPL